MFQLLGEEVRVKSMVTIVKTQWANFGQTLGVKSVSTTEGPKWMENVPGVPGGPIILG